MATPFALGSSTLRVSHSGSPNGHSPGSSRAKASTWANAVSHMWYGAGLNKGGLSVAVPRPRRSRNTTESPPTAHPAVNAVLELPADVRTPPDNGGYQWTVLDLNQWPLACEAPRSQEELALQEVQVSASVHRCPGQHAPAG